MRRGEGEKEAGKTCQSAPKVLLAESEGVKSSEKREMRNENIEEY